MTLASGQGKFISDLTKLWDNPTPERTIFETGDLLEAYWAQAVVAGGVSSATITIPKVTYPPLIPLTVPLSMIPPLAAAAFEQALSLMVLGTVFVPVPPVTLIGPLPIPAGLSLPGTLTSALTPIFSTPSPVSVASIVGGLFTGYLLSWVIPVTTPPGGPIPAPIV